MERGGGINVPGARAVYLYPYRKVCIITFLLFSLSFGFADIGPENVLILVNENSATSAYIARMYRQYYPDITDNQVLFLSGLADCSGPNSGPADEIITREQYNTCIAGPLRAYFIANPHLFEQIMVIITTAGMPYRIEDTTYADVIYPAGSNYNRVSQYCGQINAASVESELTCLWYADAFGLGNRMVNPYQGYRGTSISDFTRETPGTKIFQWQLAREINSTPPLMEGEKPPFAWPPCVGTTDRQFNGGDIYLTCRLDGPKGMGNSAIFAVREMLERSKRASSSHRGIHPNNGVIIFDDSLNGNADDSNRVYNLDGSINYYVFDPSFPGPPDAYSALILDDYQAAFSALTNTVIVPNDISFASFAAGHDMPVILDRRANTRTTRSILEPNKRVIFFSCFGRNGDEGSDSKYLYDESGECGIFSLSNGAVFTSLESYNGATLFSDVETLPTAQCKIIDFLAIGGSGAIGHAFEPMASAAIDNVFLAYNLFADEDADGRADLTFVEAAFTAIPFLSWAEVVIGDPLMRIAYGPGETAHWDQIVGDVNGDGHVNIRDMVCLRNLIYFSGNPSLNSSVAEKRKAYDDRCDLDQDGYNNIRDIIILRNLLYSK